MCCQEDREAGALQEPLSISSTAINILEGKAAGTKG